MAFSDAKAAGSSRRFAAFDNRNFRLYFVGQTISSIGSWTHALAVTWLVLELTNRSDRLGITGSNRTLVGRSRLPSPGSHWHASLWRSPQGSGRSSQ